ncbi:RDD family protein [Glaciihabitans sp. dw_435]|uniref:RDD family protein n=1 Tax=Glaciihabitans sp. dw_435 TaxID=2720081 RepID=UPI001BD4E356|nr:RDD family protein [Glaciihabitans sp. dw_435]
MPESRPVPTVWPGKRLGLPMTGSRSIARIGRRILALAIDWALSVLISTAFFHYDPFATLLVFVVIQVVFVLTLSGSIGHLLLGLRVVRIEGGGYVGVWRPFVRAILIAIVIPAVIWDRDQRGMHDRLLSTALVLR